MAAMLLRVAATRRPPYRVRVAAMLLRVAATRRPPHRVPVAATSLQQHVVAACCDKLLQLVAATRTLHCWLQQVAAAMLLQQVVVVALKKAAMPPSSVHVAATGCCSKPLFLP